jgi:hypothetical protein
MAQKPFTCSACGAQFAGLGYFEKHRIGDYANGHPHYGRRCRSPEEMRALGLDNAQDDGLWRDPAAAKRMRDVFSSGASGR